MPFSLWKTTSRFESVTSANTVGIPMPRLTNQPSGISANRRWAISRRVHRGRVSATSPGEDSDVGLLTVAPNHDHSIDEHARCHDHLGIERTERHDGRNLHD